MLGRPAAEADLQHPTLVQLELEASRSRSQRDHRVQPRGRQLGQVAGLRHHQLLRRGRRRWRRLCHHGRRPRRFRGSFRDHWRTPWDHGRPLRDHRSDHRRTLRYSRRRLGRGRGCRRCAFRRLGIRRRGRRSSDPERLGHRLADARPRRRRRGLPLELASRKEQPAQLGKVAAGKPLLPVDGSLALLRQLSAQPFEGGDGVRAPDAAVLGSDPVVPLHPPTLPSP